VQDVVFQKTCKLSVKSCEAYELPARSLTQVFLNLNRARLSALLTLLAADTEDANPRSGEEVRVEIQQELEKERSATVSAAEEAMAMILCLEKEKSVLEIEARQQRRTADERFTTALSKESIINVEGVVSLPKEPLKATTQQVRSTCILLCNLLMQFLSSESSKPVPTDLMRISMFILLLP